MSIIFTNQVIKNVRQLTPQSLYFKLNPGANMIQYLYTFHSFNHSRSDNFKAYILSLFDIGYINKILS